MKQMKTLTVNGESYVVTDPNAARLDDTKVGADAWSGVHTVDTLAPGFAQDGAVVQCQPVPGYPLEVVSHLAASDTAVTAVNLTRCGKNIIGKLETGLYLSPGGEASTIKGFVRSVDYLPVTPGQTYTFSKDGTAITVYVHEYDANKQWLRRPSVNAVLKYTPPEDVRFIRFNTNNAEHTPEDAFQLELGNSATAYEPYRGDTFCVELGREVSGGTYNWTTGVLTDQDGNTYRHTPTEIVALSGLNTLYSDTGDTAVTGRADPTALMEKLTNAIIALGGNL